MRLFESPPLPDPFGTLRYRDDRHVCLLADTTGKGFYDFVMFGDTRVHVVQNSRSDPFESVTTLPQSYFTYESGWRVDKHIRYMVDVRRTGRADIIGFGTQVSSCPRTTAMECSLRPPLFCMTLVTIRAGSSTSMSGFWPTSTDKVSLTSLDLERRASLLRKTRAMGHSTIPTIFQV